MIWRGTGNGERFLEHIDNVGRIGQPTDPGEW